MLLHETQSPTVSQVPEGDFKTSYPGRSDRSAEPYDRFVTTTATLGVSSLSLATSVLLTTLALDAASTVTLTGDSAMAQVFAFRDLQVGYEVPSLASMDDEARALGWRPIPTEPIPVRLAGILDMDWHLEPDEMKL